MFLEEQKEVSVIVTFLCVNLVALAMWNVLQSHLVHM